MLLVDMSPTVVDFLTEVAEFNGPTEILHRFAEDPFRYPLRDELLSAAWSWILNPNSLERLQYYSAEEGEQEEVPEASHHEEEEAAGEAQDGLPIAGSTIAPGKRPKASAAPKQKKPTVAQLASSFEGLMAALPALTSQIAELNKRTKVMEEQIKAPDRLSIESASWQISYSWIYSKITQPCFSSSEGNAPTCRCRKSKAARVGADLCRAGDNGASAGEEGFFGGRGHDKGDVCPVLCNYSFGCAACKYEWRHHDRPGWDINGSIQQGCHWEDEAASGACCTSWHILSSSLDEHEQTHESCQQSRSNSSTTPEPGSLPHEVCGKVRRLWQVPGHGICDVAGCDVDGLPAGRKLARSPRFCGTTCGLFGTNCPRRVDGCGASSVIGGGSAFGLVHEQVPGPIVKGKSICTACRTKMDNSCPAVYQGARRDLPKKVRFGVGQAGVILGSYFSAGAEGKAKASAKMEEEEGPGGRAFGGCVKGMRADGWVGSPGEGTCPGDRCCPDPLSNSTVGALPSSGQRMKRRRAGGPKKAVKSHAGVPHQHGSLVADKVQPSISFQSVAAALPRWILEAKTPFSAYLARTFSLQRRGVASPSVVFPLPLADVGIFKGGGPKLSRRRWMTLVRKRPLHVVIVALNFLYDGFNPGDALLLGRRPKSYA